MAAPLLTSASVTTLNNSSSSAGTLAVALSASGNDRILVIACLAKDNVDPEGSPSTITLDSAGVNRTIGAGITQQGSRQLAIESPYSSQFDLYFVLEADLPTAAGTYNVDVVMTAAVQYNMWLCFEVTGCVNQNYDNLVQSFNTADVGAATPFSDTITPIDADCLVVDMWATSHSAAPTYTTSQTLITSASNAYGGFISSQITQSGSPVAQTMTEESSTLHQRRAWGLLSFSGLSNAATGTLNSTLGNVTSTGSGKLTVKGTANNTLGNVTLAGAGSVQAVTGALNQTLENIAITTIGKINVSGTLVQTLAGASLVGTGSTQSLVSGTLNKTLENINFTGVGAVQAVIGALNVGLGDIGVAANGLVTVKGTLNQTLGNVTMVGGNTTSSLSPAMRWWHSIS